MLVQLGRATAKLHCVGDADSDHTLVPFQTEEAIGTMLGGRRQEFVDDLVAFAIAAALDQVPELGQGEIVDVMVGCGFPEQRQGMNLGRRAALLAGIGEIAATADHADFAIRHRDLLMQLISEAAL